jgi:type III secretory pathway component EscU
MCLPRVCGLILSILINVPLVGFVLSLNQGKWEFKLFAIPFGISPVMAMIIFCNRRGSCLSRTALFLLLLSLVVKGVGATFAGLAIAATSTINSVFGRLGVIVYALVMGIFLISGLSDLYLFCTEIYRTSKEPKRELVRSSDLFA